MTPGFERVYAIPDYHDGPRSGIANFRDRPHFFRNEWDDGLDDWATSFVLTPLPADLFVDALEDWEIWLRWERAFHAGASNLDEHPALPADQARHRQLEGALGPRLESRALPQFLAQAEFQPIVPPEAHDPPLGQMSPLQVRWTVDET